MSPGRHAERGRGHGRRGGGRRSAARTRYRDRHDRWVVHARVERLVEPVLLMELAEGSTHGYELADAIEARVPGERVDVGNLYRLLRTLEEEGIVTSEWRDDLPGRTKRTYHLTDSGRDLLAVWRRSLVDLTVRLGDLLDGEAADPTTPEPEESP